MARMKTYYKETVAPALMKKFGYKSVMQIPKLDKIVVNVGCGEAKDDQKKIDAIRGMDINFVTTAKTDEEARELLALMGAPFAK